MYSEISPLLKEVLYMERLGQNEPKVLDRNWCTYMHECICVEIVEHVCVCACLCISEGILTHMFLILSKERTPRSNDTGSNEYI